MVLGRKDGEEVAKNQTAQPTVFRGDDRRRLVPLAIVSVLTTLIDDLEQVPSPVRVELRTLRTRLCRLYGIDNPQDPANASALAWDTEDEDGVPPTLP